MSPIPYIRIGATRSRSSSLDPSRTVTQRLLPSLLGCLLASLLIASGAAGPTPTSAQSIGPERALLVKFEAAPEAMFAEFDTDRPAPTEPRFADPERALLGTFETGREGPAGEPGADEPAVGGVGSPDAGQALLGLNPPADRKEIAGTFTAAYTNRQTAEIPDTPGHVLMLTQAKGSNRNTGPTDYMDGAAVANAETVDLVQGNGPHQGYVQFTGDGSSVVAKWSGNVTTTMSSENQPTTTFKGTWKYVNGTGEYTGIQGDGTYEGRMTSETDYVVNWRGSYSK